MKIRAMILCVPFILAGNCDVWPQADCGYWVRITVKDRSESPVANAKLKLDNWKEFYYRENLARYEAWGLRGVGAPVWDAKLRVRAKGFKPFIKELSLTCGHFDFMLLLSPTTSNAPAVFEQITSNKKNTEK
jgi:hypothetical protein